MSIVTYRSQTGFSAHTQIVNTQNWLCLVIIIPPSPDIIRKSSDVYSIGTLKFIQFTSENK